MKNYLAALLFCFPFGVFGETGGEASSLKVLDGASGDFSMEKSKILKVYAAEKDGARFRAYVVEWNGQEVIVGDIFGHTDKRVGDTVHYMAHRMEMDHEGETLRMLQFQIMEFPGMNSEDLETETQPESTGD